MERMVCTLQMETIALIMSVDVPEIRDRSRLQAILHEERCLMQRAWARWRQRTQQQVKEGEKEEASQRLYMHRLLHKTMTQWKDNSTEIRDR